MKNNMAMIVGTCPNAWKSRVPCKPTRDPSKSYWVARFLLLHYTADDREDAAYMDKTSTKI